jgi:triacylglycerol esterase/lipase EstA (alpha/beta hydrolase family)
MIAAWIVFALMSALLFGSALWVGIGYTGHFFVTKQARPGLGAYVRAFSGEWWANVRTWAAYPLAWLPVGAPAAFDKAGGVPIVLVHGYMMNRTAMYALRRALVRHGFRNVVYIEPRPKTASLEKQADMFASALRRVSAWADEAPVTIIAHSQGGLIARIATVRHADLPVAQIISIGSPHAGTVLAGPTFTANGVQMRWGSAFLKGLPPPRVRFTSIYSNLDNIVFPKESSVLGESIEVIGLGHHAMCMSPKVLEHVLAALGNADG